MNVIALSSGLALALFAGSLANAQETVGGQPIAQEDMIVVQDHCNDLVRAASGAEPGAGPQGTAPHSEGGAAGSTLGNDTSGLDLAAITLEDCQAAGIVELTQ